MILSLGGVLAFLGGWIWLAVIAFRTSPLWGVTILICPTFAAPVLALDHWNAMRWPILLHHGGLLGVIVGVRLLNLSWH